MINWIKDMFGSLDSYTESEVKYILKSWNNAYNTLLDKSIKGFVYEPLYFKELNELTSLLDKYDSTKNEKKVSVPLEYKSRGYKKYINQLVSRRWTDIERATEYSYIHRKEYYRGTSRNHIKHYDIK